MNTAKNELLPLTPSCGENGQNNQEMENWRLHCDRNGNGLIEDGEVVETVKVWADIRILCFSRQNCSIKYSCFFEKFHLHLKSRIEK